MGNSRIIKFRAWDKHNKRMIPWSPQMFSDSSPLTMYGDDFPENDDDFILMQFTGCHDRNGQEIWEGDIVKYFINTGFWTGRDDPPDIDEMTEYIEAVYWMDELTGFNPLCGTPYEDIEVIGNIYEHPEMLKEPYAYNQD